MNSVVEGHDLSGTTLDDRYSLVGRLGEGAMGQVYVAHDRAMDGEVAVKLLHPWLAAQARHRQRFLRAARAATRIKHPHVVEILDLGTASDDSVYLVMELLQGRDLESILRHKGALSWPRARNLLIQAVGALREAHRQEVIHRDIKPANCFVCVSPEPGLPDHMKLLDFGIAKIGDEYGTGEMLDKSPTRTGELVGTLAYMAPEFADGQPASIYSDMYALGIMAYQLVTGGVPFTGRNEFQVLARHLSEPPVRPRQLVPELPEAAESVILTLLAKKPEHRFESMVDIEHALFAIPADGPALLVLNREQSGGAPLIRRREPSTPQARARPALRPARPPPGPAPSLAVYDRAPPPPPRVLYDPPNDEPPARWPRPWPTVVVALIVSLVSLIAIVAIVR